MAISTDPAALRLWTQTWSSIAAWSWSWSLLWSQVAVQAIHISIVSGTALTNMNSDSDHGTGHPYPCPQTTTLVSDTNPDLSISIAGHGSHSGRSNLESEPSLPKSGVIRCPGSLFRGCGTYNLPKLLAVPHHPSDSIGQRMT